MTSEVSGGSSSPLKPTFDWTFSGWKTYIGLVGVVLSNAWKLYTKDETVPQFIQIVSEAFAAGGLRHALSTTFMPLINLANDPKTLTKEVVSGALAGLRS